MYAVTPLLSAETRLTFSKCDCFCLRPLAGKCCQVGPCSFSFRWTFARVLMWKRLWIFFPPILNRMGSTIVLLACQSKTYRCTTLACPIHVHLKQLCTLIFATCSRPGDRGILSTTSHSTSCKTQTIPNLSCKMCGRSERRKWNPNTACGRRAVCTQWSWTHLLVLLSKRRSQLCFLEKW